MKKPIPTRFRKSRGFSLIVTLVMMVLLTVIALGLLTLSTITLRSASQGDAMATARNNARLALMLAIGDLQRTLGPDKAISAPSEILASAPSKPRMAGAWESWDFNPNATTVDYAGEKKSRFRRWLVSTPEPADAANRDFINSSWTGKTVELVGDATLGGKANASDKAVAGLVPVSKNGKVQGSYAWHVSDESLKARINLYRKPTNSTDAVWQKRAILTGQRPDTSVMKGPSGGNLGFLPTDLTSSDFTKAQESTGKITDLEQVNLMDTSGTIRQFRNDVTPSSLGVITDVRRGQLKQDLSSIFEMTTSLNSIVLPTEFNNKKLYQSTHNITGVSDPYWSTLSGYYNTFRSITTPDSIPTFYQFPTESQLVGSPTAPKKFYPGPVIAKVEALFTYVTRDSHANWVGTLKGVDPKMLYMGHLVYSPLVTLHNPYNVNLSFDNMEVVIRNVPVSFNFYVNDKPQCTGPVSLNDMFVNGSQRGEKSFYMKIANWTSPTSTTTSGPIVMKPGQTLVCGAYLDPGASFSNTMGTPFFDWQNNLTGVDNGGNLTAAINARPGFAGRCVGFDVDWTTPTHLSSGQQTDNNQGVLGLRDTDRVYIEYAVKQPTSSTNNTSFEVTAKITSQNRTFDYGGLSFQYQDTATLQKFFPKTYRYPTSGTFGVADTYCGNSDPISSHALAKSFCMFSAYARTTNGGVYETGKRSTTAGALNTLRDGSLAGKPFLFHNPARTVVSINLQREKPGGQSHELNFQPLQGSVDDVLERDSTNRTNYLTGNTTTRGIKSGSYLELQTGPMQTIADFRRSNALTTPYLPNFVQPVGNSQVSPLMSTNKVNQTDSTIASYALLDQSVLANHAFYDRFYFSTFATYSKATPSTAFDNFMTDTPLISQAFQPYLPEGRTAQTAKDELFASGKPKDGAYKLAAEYQLIKGPFNVNSTSVQAWKALLASMNKSDIVSLWAKNSVLEILKSKGTPILPMTLVNGSATNSPTIDTNKIDNARTNEWNGYRELSDADLENLASKIVDQVRLRGPFLSMSEFVNRQIGTESDLSRSGALEAAITQAKLNDAVFTTQVPITAADVSNTTLYNYKTPTASVGNPAAGAPGWISQGDLMRIIEPTATVRSDTFVVRTCGQAQDSSGNITARAYLEAVVQRIPEYVVSDAAANRPSANAYTDATVASENKFFGRRMKVVSFRWLSSTEI